VKLWAIWEDGGGAHEPQGLMSLWTTREAAEAEIVSLQAAYGRHYRGRPEDFKPQRFWLNEVETDKSYGIDDSPERAGSPVPYPPYD
jgi:hypothetical protein